MRSASRQPGHSELGRSDVVSDPLKEVDQEGNDDGQGVGWAVLLSGSRDVEGPDRPTDDPFCHVLGRGKPIQPNIQELGTARFECAAAHPLVRAAEVIRTPERGVPLHGVRADLLSRSAGLLTQANSTLQEGAVRPRRRLPACSRPATGGDSTRLGGQERTLLGARLAARDHPGEGAAPGVTPRTGSCQCPVVSSIHGRLPIAFSTVRGQPGCLLWQAATSCLRVAGYGSVS